jgi:HEAT repeat protein
MDLMPFMREGTLAVLASTALLVFGLSGAQNPPDGDGPAKEKAAQGKSDAEILRTAGIGTDSASLLAYLKVHAPAENDVPNLKLVVKQLGDDEFDLRQSAVTRLVSLGPIALPLLYERLNEDDVEVRRLAQECISRIEKHKDATLAVVRKLSFRSSAGATPALLSFLTDATDEETEEVVWNALAAIAHKQAKVEAECEQMLQHKSVTRRTAVHFVLARYGDVGQRDQAAKGLESDSIAIRLRTAQGLLGAADERSVPALIELLVERDVTAAWQAEELLRWLAAEQSPRALVGIEAPDGRQACQKAWQTWWKHREKRLHVRDREENFRRPGLILLSERVQDDKDGRVCLVGCDSTSRCEWRGSQAFIAAGKFIWKQRIPDPTVIAILPNGTSLVMSTGRVVTLNPSGRIVGEHLCERNPDGLRACYGLLRAGFGTPRLDFGDPMPSSNTDTCVLTRLRVQALGAKEPWIRRRAAETLGAMKSDGVGGILGLQNAMGDSDAALARAAEDALEQIGAKSVMETLTHINAHDPLTRLQAVEKINRYLCQDRGVAARMYVAALLRALTDEDPRVRERAAVAMMCMKLEADRVVPALVRALDDTEPEVRYSAIHSLGRLGADGKRAVPVLLRLLHGDDLDMRHYAARSLGMIGAVDPSVVPALAEALKDEHARRMAAYGLSIIGPEAKDTIPALIVALDAPTPSQSSESRLTIRDSVIFALGSFGEDGAPAVPALVRILENANESRELRLQAVIALGRIGPSAKGTVPLIHRLSHLGGSFETACAEALARISEVP